MDKEAKHVLVYFTLRYVSRIAISLKYYNFIFAQNFSVLYVSHPYNSYITVYLVSCFNCCCSNLQV